LTSDINVDAKHHRTGHPELRQEMTQNTYTRIQFQNAIAYRDQHAQEMADAHELVTPFTIVPGTRIYDVTIRPTFEPYEVIVTIGLLGGVIEQRIMPKRDYTYQLAQAYAANAEVPTIKEN